MTKYIIRSKFKDFLGNHEYIAYTDLPTLADLERNRVVKFSRDKAYQFDTYEQAQQFLDKHTEIEEYTL